MRPELPLHGEEGDERMILNVAMDLADATYVRCDWQPCSKIARCRTREQNGQTQILPPIGWVIPRRTGETVNPTMQSAAYCCIEHECRADGIEQPVWDSIEALSPSIAKVSSLPEASESGHYGAPRLMDARR